MNKFAFSFALVLVSFAFAQQPMDFPKMDMPKDRPFTGYADCRVICQNGEIVIETSDLEKRCSSQIKDMEKAFNDCGIKKNKDGRKEAKINRYQKK